MEDIDPWVEVVEGEDDARDGPGGGEGGQDGAGYLGLGLRSESDLSREDFLLILWCWSGGASYSVPPGKC